MKKPRMEEVISLLVEARAFDRERVEKTAKKIEEAYRRGQSTLDRWF